MPEPRRSDELRPVRITPHFLNHPPGSCLIEVGKTRLVCAVNVDEGVPHFLKGSGKGWLTAEYSMLPGSSDQRIRRERSRVGGRTSEIQRLIGRSLRACVDMAKLGERTLLVDCDVLDADGGTRTAAITGGFVATVLALRACAEKNSQFSPVEDILSTKVAAISVGIIKGEPYLDLDYQLDQGADVDMNIVKTSQGLYVEVQGTAEAKPFDLAQMQALLKLADKGIEELFHLQDQVLEA